MSEVQELLKTQKEEAANQQKDQSLIIKHLKAQLKMFEAVKENLENFDTERAKFDATKEEFFKLRHKEAESLRRVTDRTQQQEGEIQKAIQEIKDRDEALALANAQIGELEVLIKEMDDELTKANDIVALFEYDYGTVGEDGGCI